MRNWASTSAPGCWPPLDAITEAALAELYEPRARAYRKARLPVS